MANFWTLKLWSEPESHHASNYDHADGADGDTASPEAVHAIFQNIQILAIDSVFQMLTLSQSTASSHQALKAFYTTL